MPHTEKPWYTPAIVAFLRDDCPRLLGLPPAAFARDVLRLEQRLACEGEAFLTKTLPSLGLSVDRALQGHVPLVHRGFKKIPHTLRPAFLQALTRRVFLDTGWLMDSPCILSIRLLRQICFWCKKIQKGYSDESQQKAVNDFVKVDQTLPSLDHRFSGRAGRLLGVARAVIGRLFVNINTLGVFHPRHGPGAVAGGETCVEKRRLNRCFTQLESTFRPIPWFFSLRDASEDPSRVTGRMQCAYGLDRFALAEKDSGGPRVIGLAPAAYMWCQQAVKRLMYDHLENVSMAAGFINFTNQSINRELAMNWADWETLDMSKASDRNSYALVAALFSGHRRRGLSRLWNLLDASRTPGTILPDGQIMMYKKFAPMGSATCFPTMASVFYALACAVLHEQGMPLTLTFSRVFIYGDDLIVPRNYYEALNEGFQAVGLQFNSDKCCIHGKFRESCGMDAFAGEEVTPVRMKKVTIDGRGQLPLASIVEHANALYMRGYTASAIAFRESALFSDEIKEYRIPLTRYGNLPILSWLNKDIERVRIRYKNWIPTVKGWVFKPAELECSADGEVRYLRESLSSGGPVGKLSSRGGRRTLQKKYSGKFVKRQLAVWPSVVEC